MTDGLKWTVNEVPKSDDTYLELMSEANVQKANEFHKSFPQYTVTPLQKLSALASFLGVKNIYCKTNPTASVSTHLRFWAVPTPWDAT